MTLKKGDKLRAGIRKVKPIDVKRDFINGLSYLDLQLKYQIGHATVARYLKENGGLTLEDRIKHLRNGKGVK